MTAERLGVPDIVRAVETRLEGARPELLQIPCVYHFHLTGSGGGDFHCQIAGGQAGTAVGPPPSHATCTVTLSLPDAVDLVAGRLNPVLAYFQGRFRVEGDFAAATRLGQLLR